MRKLKQGNYLYIIKLAEKASFCFRTPHKEPLGGVAERGLRGGG